MCYSAAGFTGGPSAFCWAAGRDGCCLGQLGPQVKVGFFSDGTAYANDIKQTEEMLALTEDKLEGFPLLRP